jgi:hypothetical protein
MQQSVVSCYVTCQAVAAWRPVAPPSALRDIGELDASFQHVTAVWCIGIGMGTAPHFAGAWVWTASAGLWQSSFRRLGGGGFDFGRSAPRRHPAPSAFSVGASSASQLYVLQLCITVLRQRHWHRSALSAVAPAWAAPAGLRAFQLYVLQLCIQCFGSGIGIAPHPLQWPRLG